MVTILMMLAKMATLDLLNIKIFRNKGWDVMVSAFDVINENLSCNSNFNIDLVMWQKFGNSRTFMREVIITTI